MSRRLAKLEVSQEGPARELSREALKRLSDEDLDALETVLEEAMKAGEGSFEYLYRVASEGSRGALDAYLDALEALNRGEELQPDRTSPGRDMVGLIKRIEEGDEEALEEWRTHDGYRIWKYR